MHPGDTLHSSDTLRPDDTLHPDDARHPDDAQHPDGVLALRNGTRHGDVTVPRLGFGVSGSRDTRAAVTEALARGYRSIDTAAVYDNETEVGAALAGSGLARAEVFVTTKVWNVGRDRGDALRSAQESLDRLGLDHVDLLLVHWPNDDLEPCLRTWEAMEQLLADGLTRAVGVSNFRPSHLRRLRGLGGTVPALNQVELHPHHQQRELRDVHAALGIATGAWSPLGRGAVLDEPVLHAIAQRHGVTPARVVLRWHLQQGTVAVPKSDDPARIAANRDLTGFTLDEGERRAIAALDVPGGAGRIGPVPDRVDRIAA
ncbi:2,5-diketo-D-gluconate reductase A [Pseudonocardia ammonioxydans]|uniref:2,5-diketo-D-gluconate reductase A n=1 Tax=Pseudonocardia ammonioxydans TaxID=260086 RepID=A0A1I4SGB8_PSUAM|nr:aldo/keto reductase [Pseudonocardia ammonioxydans]SFM63526.1 2,5-diketo-D-gluconate reductase A [Pseudonocardia ammonioxydans]